MKDSPSPLPLILDDTSALHGEAQRRGSLTPKAGFPIQTAFRSESLADLSQIGLPGSLPATGPLNFSARITPNGRWYSAGRIQLTVMGSGTANRIDPAIFGLTDVPPSPGSEASRPISGDLQSDHFDLARLTGTPNPEDGPKSSKQAKADATPQRLSFRTPRCLWSGSGRSRSPSITARTASSSLICRLRKYGPTCWLIRTGWVGDPDRAGGGGRFLPETRVGGKKTDTFESNRVS
ncbi:MAG: hypothetical protein CM1200mP20_15400 [Pseudomonadota bacterium]|nr:MAG: hypothetical protein CM1200mP20_15400 [Pseudomonadota bacterium]